MKRHRRITAPLDVETIAQIGGRHIHGPVEHQPESAAVIVMHDQHYGTLEVRVLELRHCDQQGGCEIRIGHTRSVASLADEPSPNLTGIERASRRTRARPLPAALCGATGLVLLLAPGFTLSGDDGRSLSAIELALSVLCTSAALGLWAGCAALLVRRPVSETLGLARGRLGMTSVAALVAGTAGFSHLVDWGVRSLGMREDSLLETIDTALLGTGGWALLLCIAGVAIAPGIGEEILFRGLLMRSLIRRVGIAAGIVSSAVLFGALHVDWAQGCAAAVLGVYLGAVAFASGSTRTPILCHMVNNLTAVLAASQGMGHAGWAQEPTLLALSVGGALVGLTALARTLPAAAGAWKHS